MTCKDYDKCTEPDCHLEMCDVPDCFKQPDNPQAGREAVSECMNLLNAITGELKSALYVARKKHEDGSWPEKFLYAHEGVGIIKALEAIKRHRETAGI